MTQKCKTTVFIYAFLLMKVKAKTQMEAFSSYLVYCFSLNLLDIYLKLFK